jgi:hypothetical protein
MYYCPEHKHIRVKYNYYIKPHFDDNDHDLETLIRRFFPVQAWYQKDLEML